jgi:hypothetical protein
MRVIAVFRGGGHYDGVESHTYPDYKSPPFTEISFVDASLLGVEENGTRIRIATLNEDFHEWSLGGNGQDPRRFRSVSLQASGN